jgi:hypothetical protein
LIDLILNKPGRYIKPLCEKFRRKTKPANQRTIIIHNHGFKNAGSTIDWALKKNFGRGFIDHRDDENMKKGPAYLGPYLTRHSDITALSSHHVRLPLPTLQNAKILMIMMFRHPIERVTSVYHYERKQKRAKTPGAKFARTHDLSEYVRWRLRSDVPGTIRNFHFIKLKPLPLHRDTPADAGGLKTAQKILDTNAMTGFVDRFDESMVFFEQVLRPYFPDIDLSYRIQNVNQKPEETIGQRIEQLKKEIGKKNFDALEEHNKLDLILYEYALKQFEKKINQIADFDARLNDFKTRCERYN